MKLLTIVMFLLLTSCASRPRMLTDFDFKSDEVEGKEHSLWATNYYTPVYNVKMNGVPLKDLGDNSIVAGVYPVLLTKKEWCYSAMEGSVSVKFPGGDMSTFNYAGTSTKQVDCSPYFGKNFPKTNTVRFRVARSRWGDGEGSYALIPFRTIAVDPKVIPFGKAVYIPEAKGIKFMWLGETFIHDGFFFAGDRGGAIKGSHIDLFTGTNKNHPFHFVKNKKSGVFKAIVLEDSSIAKELEILHQKQY